MLGSLRPFKRLFSSVSVPSQADVVVIGGGSVGSSTLYHLQKKGINAVMIEKGVATEGTTWHSAGLVWRLRPGDTDLLMCNYSRHMAKNVLEQETGISPGWVESGGMFIARDKVRMDEYRRMATLGKFFGIESQELSPQEAQALNPMLNVEDVYGVLYSPGDGTVDPSGIVAAYIKGAKMSGAQVFEHTKVTNILTENVNGSPAVCGVETNNGTIKTSTVINCAGCWARDIGEMAGVNVPLVAMKHAYIVMERMPGPWPQPCMRDHDLSVYFKLQGTTYAVGGYETDPVFWRPESDSAFQLFNMDLTEEFSAHYNNHMHRVPQVGEAGVQSVVSGPESFTPDHKPLMGETPELRGFWLNAGFNSGGMMLGGGAGAQMAEWIAHGHTTYDVFGYDINRYSPKVSKNWDWVKERSHEAYAKNYSIYFPNDEPLAGRNACEDPFHEDMVQAGCVFQERMGWERPGYFVGKEKSDEVKLLPYDFYGAYTHCLPEDDENKKHYHSQEWEEEMGEPHAMKEYSRPLHKNYGYKNILEKEYTFGWPESTPIIGEEVKACRDQAALFNQSYFGKFTLKGPESTAFLEYISTNTMGARKPGATVYTNMLNASGGVMCDLTVSRVDDGNGDPEWYIAAGGGSSQSDYCWINRLMKDGGWNCQLSDHTHENGMLNLQGRYSLDILKSIVDDPSIMDLSTYKFSTNKMISIQGHQIRAIRLTFMGELGFELHIPRESCRHVYKTLMEAGQAYGIRNAGYRAIDTLSAEKGYRHWHADLRMDDTPLEAGLGFICKLKKDVNFLGRQALEEQKQNGLKKRMACLTINDPEVPLHGTEGIWKDGECVGFVRSTAFGHSIGHTIAYGYVQHPDRVSSVSPEFVQSGEYMIESMGVKHPATVHSKTVFDPDNNRIKGIYS